MKNSIKWMSRISLGILLMLPIAVFAKENPVYDETQKSFFANGTPIVISERTDGVAGAKITWDGGEQLVSSTINVFGGGHETDTVFDTTSITMNSGSVNNIFGGGLHKSYVKTTNVVVNGGTLISINGGGASSANWTNCHTPWFDGKDMSKAINKVDVANVTINGGSTAKAGYNTIFGGGEGHSYTKTANLTVNGGTWDYVIAGGSNGYTGNATLKVTNGKISVLQSVNRGSMDKADMTISGGTIDKAYVGGENDKNVTGTIKNANMNITGGTVANALVGTNGGPSVSAKDIAKLEYLNGTVTNIDETTFNTDNVVAKIKLTFNSMGNEETILVEKGTVLTEEEINELKNIVVDGYKIVGYYIDADFNNEYDLTNPFNTDTTIYIKLEKIVEVKNPDTSDINLGMTIALIGFSVVGLGCILKSKKLNA